MHSCNYLFPRNVDCLWDTVTAEGNNPSSVVFVSWLNPFCFHYLRYLVFYPHAMLKGGIILHIKVLYAYQPLALVEPLMVLHCAGQSDYCLHLFYFLTDFLAIASDSIPLPIT